MDIDKGHIIPKWTHDRCHVKEASDPKNGHSNRSNVNPPRFGDDVGDDAGDTIKPRLLTSFD